MLKFAMPLYEAKYHETDDWMEISELELMDQLYRTYTYTKAGYDKLLRAAGFNRLEYYYPLPTYKQLESLIPLTQPSLLAFYYDYLQTLPDQDEDEITDQIKELEIKAIADGDIEQKVSSYAIIVEKANG